ncbi:hypothetical protein PHLH5_44700 [Pseudomonas sp. Cab53]|uniref:SEFIR domain-containing protein n=1 Tax=Pseudomonas sp. Cab53 TaxID=2678258 RepID=UPI001BB3E0C8|nr:SEFIR domain-containing protein [Pseudomonas sp. Cab53]BBP66929.1 hypothetical protein PHLH5_44700 [Pseudomonas sp. Cab53]
MKEPKVFISYSWSSPSHERWVLDLAENLMASGVEVKLDKWDLRPGGDAVAFMESMVTDKTIDKVLIISDKNYSEKADERRGGVGTETQIISKKVYEQVDQERFIAVIAEKDEEGKAYTPIFYHSRLYIDLSSPETYSEGFEELIRCIYGQPQYQRPKLGKKPDFLNKEVAINLGTAPLARRAITSIKEGKNIAGAALEEYLMVYSENLERIRIKPNSEVLFDEQVVENITEFVSCRNELLQVITSAVRYLDQQGAADFLHKFLESILKYQEAPEHLNVWRETDFDNYKFIIHEIFLYAITICLKYGKFFIVAQLLDRSYYVNSRRSVAYLSGYECFYKDVGALNQRNSRLNLNRLSLSADLTKELNSTSGIDFSILMQTDFLLFTRCEIHRGHWWPKTLVYLGHFPGAFEIFIRSASAPYFENLKQVLKVNGKTELEQFAVDATQRGGHYYGFGRLGVDWKRLLNLDDLGSLP